MGAFGMPGLIEARNLTSSMPLIPAFFSSELISIANSAFSYQASIIRP